jgi:hypothetical protein
MSTPTKAGEIIRKFQGLEKRKVPWTALWQLIADNVVPIRLDMYQTLTKGFELGHKIYDGTPNGALQLFASGLHGYMISPTNPWFKLRLPRYGLDDLPEVRKWLQESAEQLYYTFDETNFYARMWRYFEDGGSVGTATTFFEEDVDRGTATFHDIHPGEIYIAENKYNQVDTHFRCFKQEIRKLVQRFGKDALPKQLHPMIDREPETEIEVLHGVFPREDRDVTKIDAKNKKFMSVWMVKDGRSSEQESDDNILHVGGLDQNPYLTWRYKKNSQEVYGRSPAMEVLPEIVGLHKISKTLLGAAHMMAEPPLNVPSTQRGKVQYKPRGFNYFSDPNHKTEPWQMRGNYPVGVDREERKQATIEQAFMVDMWLMLSRSEGQMTATEVIEKAGEKATVAGAMVGRLNNETLDSAVDRLFEMEMANGRMPDPPGVLDEFLGENIHIEYIGPLAQAQRRMVTTQGILRGWEAMAPMLELMPSMADTIDPDETARRLLVSFGWPEHGLRTPKEIAEVRQIKQEAIEQEEAAEGAMMATEGLKNIGQADQALGGKLSSNVEQVLEGAG